VIGFNGRGAQSGYAKRPATYWKYACYNYPTHGS